MARLRIALVLGLALALPAAPAGGREDDGWRPFTGRLPGEHGRQVDGKSFVWAGQVVSGETGGPVAGARVRVHSECGRVVVDGEGTLVGEGRADDDGFVELGFRMDLRPGHWLLEAPGFAPRTETRFWREWPSEPAIENPRPVVELGRGEAFWGRVVDPLGRPRPGVRVSVYEGCRHAPAQRRALTDAAGRFRLESVVSTRLWVEGGEVAGSYADQVRDRDGGTLVLARPGVTVEGRVVDPKGLPLEGIWVRRWERGPSTRTGADGRFRLEGAEAGCPIGLATDRLPEKNGVVQLTEAATVLDAPLPMLLRFDPRDASVVDPEGVEVRIPLGGSAEGARVALIHEETGLAESTLVEGGVARLEVPPGRHQVRVGSPFGPVWWRPFTEVVAKAGPLPLPDPPPVVERPRLALRIAGLPSPQILDELFTYFRLVSATGESRSFEPGDGPFPVPAGEPLALHLHCQLLPYTIVPFSVPADASGDIERTVRFEFPPRVRLALPRRADSDRVRIHLRVAEDGPLRSAQAWEEEDEAFAFVLPEGGARQVLVEAGTGEFASIDLPPRIEGDGIDLGRLELKPARRVAVTVKDDLGRPVPGATVGVLAERETDWNESSYSLRPDERRETGPDGVAVFARTLPVQRILVGGPDLWGIAIRTRGDGPFEVELPSSSVIVTAPGGAEPRGWLHGRRMGWDPSARRLRLRGVPAGSHRLIVALADGRRFVRRVELGKGEEVVVRPPR